MSKPSQADQAHIATAAYWREQNAGIDRMAKLKSLRLAREATSVPRKSPRKKTVAAVSRPPASPRPRWGR